MSVEPELFTVDSSRQPSREARARARALAVHVFFVFQDSTFQIMGSYRRGSSESGDIDICITDKNDDTGVFVKFIDALIQKGILIEVLSRGNSKSLGVSQLKGKPARRIDFMFSKHNELAFALLYFTGSKAFNTVMRMRALDLKYSMIKSTYST